MTDLTAVLKRDRLIVVAALAAITLLAWAYLIWLAAMPMPEAMAGMDDMANMPGMVMAPAFTAWTPAHAFVTFIMWAVMMLGMMTPSAAPMILVYAGVARQARSKGMIFAAAGWFACGYLLAWTGFAALATCAQYGLERLALLSPAMVATSRYFGAAVLVAAGLYQFTPFKNACLAQCRAPFSFIQRHGGFRPGALSSLRLGVVHGLYCIGCCWSLMALLFVGGVMNLFWIAGLMIFVLLEKLLPGGRVVSGAAGVAALAGAVWLIAAA